MTTSSRETSVPSIAVLGAGAVGCAVGARLAEKFPDQVSFCLRSPFRTLSVKCPERELKLQPRISLRPEEATAVDWLLVATKAHQLESAAPWLRVLVAENTRVAVLQNGVEHKERLGVFVDALKLLPAVVACPAKRLAPGQIEQRSAAKLIVEDSELGRDFRDLFQGTDIEVETSPDWKSAAWRKLCLNVAGGAITALTRKGQGVVHFPGVAELARDLVQECFDVGRAEGAQLEDSLVEEIVDELRRAPKDAGTSVLSDLLAGRPLEVDARNGAVVRFGRKWGIATPLNRMATVLLATCNQPS